MPRLVCLALPCLILPLSLALSGCYDLYALPDPPPADQWTQAGLDPTQDEVNQERDALDARKAALALYEKLSAGALEEAWALLSTETHNFLTFGNPDGDGLKALGEGSLTLPGGEPERFDPVDLFLVRDLQRLDDEHPDFPQEAETTHRKELYAISADARVHKVVLIREEGQWRVHRTALE
jgi:hypothetical protein